MKYRVDLHKWNSNGGYYATETFDKLDEYMTAEDYVNSLDDSLMPSNPNEAINVEIVDVGTDAIVSEYWLQREVEV